MQFNFFDVNMYIGRKNDYTIYRPALSGYGLLDCMDEAGIGKAMVWHAAQIDYSVPEGNSLLIGAISGHERLYGSWMLLPPQTGEIPDLKELLVNMKKDRIFSLRALPAIYHYLLNRATFGDILDEISARRIPLFLSVQRNGGQYEYIYDILREFPELTCIVCDVGVWGQDRYFRPLLENYKNVYMETSRLSVHNGVIEDLVFRYGAERLVFGSGFPEMLPEAAMFQLVHSDIGENEKAKIAGGNMERLLKGVAL